MDERVTDPYSDYNGLTYRAAVRDLEDRVKALEAIIERSDLS